MRSIIHTICYTLCSVISCNILVYLFIVIYIVIYIVHKVDVCIIVAIILYSKYKYSNIDNDENVVNNSAIYDFDMQCSAPHIWKKPYQCTVTHIWGEPYQCKYIKVKLYQYVCKYIWEKLYQCRYPKVSFSHYNMMLNHIEKYTREQISSSSNPLVLYQIGITGEKAFQCYSFYNYIAYVIIKLNRYILIHTEYRWMDVYPIYRIGRSMFIIYHHEYCR